MMAIAFSIGSNVDELIELTGGRKSAHKAIGKTFTVTEQAFEGDGLRNRAVVKKQSQPLFRGQFGEIRMSGVNAGARDVVIAAAALAANALGLARRENGELDSVFGENFQRFGIDCGFREPHTLRLPPETAFEVGNAPFDLRDLVAPIGQRQNYVVIALCDGRAVTGKMLAALLVGVDNSGIDAWSGLL